MTRKAKILVISHLCLAFTYLFWFLLSPWLEEVLIKKEEISLFESVIGQEVFFSALEEEKQSAIRSGYQQITKSPSSSYIDKLHSPLFSLLWIGVSIGVALLLLLHIEGAKQVALVLPLIVLGYGVSLYLNPITENENSVFPSEESVVINYGKASGGRIGKKELKAAWANYLIDVWAKQEPSEHIETYQKQVALGTFAFNIERVNRRLQGEPVESLWSEILRAPPSSLLLLFYFTWNLFFVLYVRRKAA